MTGLKKFDEWYLIKFSGRTTQPDLCRRLIRKILKTMLEAMEWRLKSPTDDIDVFVGRSKKYKESENDNKICMEIGPVDPVLFPMKK